MDRIGGGAAQAPRSASLAGRGLGAVASVLVIAVLVVAVPVLVVAVAVPRAAVPELGVHPPAVPVVVPIGAAVVAAAIRVVGPDRLRGLLFCEGRQRLVGRRRPGLVGR